jgi:hypothetical protein
MLTLLVAPVAPAIAGLFAWRKERGNAARTKSSSPDE